MNAGSNQSTLSNGGLGAFGGAAVGRNFGTPNGGGGGGGTKGVNFTPLRKKTYDQKKRRNFTYTFYSINMIPQFASRSTEELRMADYGMNAGTGGGAFGAMGNTTNAFASTPGNTGGAFGATTGNTGGAFGGTTGGAFGATTGNTGGAFGNTTGGAFGTTNGNASNAFGGATGGAFGATTGSTGGAFGGTTGGGAFGSTSLGGTTGGGAFGSTSLGSTTGGGAFGSTSLGGTTGGGAFGSTSLGGTTGGGAFGSTSLGGTTGGGAFGSTSLGGTTGGGAFGSTSIGGGGAFGSTSLGGTTGGGAFGSTSLGGTTGGGAFGSTALGGGGAFGSTSTNAFGSSTKTNSSALGGFGSSNNTAGGTGGISFGGMGGGSSGFNMGAGSGTSGGFNMGGGNSGMNFGSSLSGAGAFGSGGNSGVSFSTPMSNPAQGMMGTGGGLLMGSGGNQGLVTGGGGRFPYHTRSYAKLRHFLKDTTSETKLTTRSLSNGKSRKGMDMIVTRTHLRPRMFPATAFMSPILQSSRALSTGSASSLFESDGTVGGRQILSPDISRPRKRLELRRPKSMESADQSPAVPGGSKVVRFADSDDALNKRGSEGTSTALVTSDDAASARKQDRAAETKRAVDPLIIGASPDEKVSSYSTTPSSSVSFSSPRKTLHVEPAEEPHDAFLQKHMGVSVTPHLSRGNVVTATKVEGTKTLEVSEEKHKFEPPTLGKEYEKQRYYMIPEPEYWDRCTEKQLRQQTTFIVGREDIAKIVFTFDEKRPFPVEYLSGRDLSDFITIDRVGKYPRVKVYPHASDESYPKAGEALNVPSIITLFNIEIPKSVRSKGPEKIREKLRSRVEHKRNGEAKFLGYNDELKALKMKVPHFTQYSMFEDDDEEEDEEDDDTAESKMRSDGAKDKMMPAYRSNESVLFLDDCGTLKECKVISVVVSKGEVEVIIVTRGGTHVRVKDMKRLRRPPSVDEKYSDPPSAILENEGDGDGYISFVDHDSDEGDDIEVDDDIDEKAELTASILPSPDVSSISMAQSTIAGIDEGRTTVHRTAARSLPAEVGLNPANLTRQSVWLFGTSSRRSDRHTRSDAITNIDAPEKIREDAVDANDALRDEERASRRMQLDISKDRFAPPMPLVVVAPSKVAEERADLNTSIRWPLPLACENRRIKRCEDARNMSSHASRRPFYMGRSFRACFGAGGKLFHTGRVRLAGVTDGRFNSDVPDLDRLPTSRVCVEQIYATAPSARTSVSALNVDLLNLSLGSSTIDASKESPRVIPKNGGHIVHLMKAYVDRMKKSDDACALRDVMLPVWNLLKALYGEPVDLPTTAEALPTPDALHDVWNMGSTVPISNTSVTRKHRERMIRREAVVRWLRQMIGVESSSVENKGEHKADADEKISLLVSHLMSGNVEGAFKAAVDEGNLRLASLVSQVGGDERTKTLLNRQIQIWLKLGSDRFIDASIFQAYALLAGNRMRAPSASTWKQALLLEFLYFHAPNSTIGEVVADYVGRVENVTEMTKLPPPPVPRYLEKSLPSSAARDASREGIRSTEWHLLRFFCERGRSMSLIGALKSWSHVSDPLERTISWHLLRALMPVLPEVGCGTDDDCELGLVFSRLRRDFIAQLEAEGLWEWAVFVALHSSSNCGRENVAKDIISRNTPALSRETSVSHPLEWFSTRFRGAIQFFARVKIPSLWCNEAAAWRSKYDGHVSGLMTFLPEIRRWRESHDVLMDRIMVHCTVTGQESDQVSLFRFLAMHEEHMGDDLLWEAEGNVVLTFFRLATEYHKRVKGIDRDKASENLKIWWNDQNAKQRFVDLSRRFQNWWHSTTRKRCDFLARRCIIDADASRLWLKAVSIGNYATRFALMYSDIVKRLGDSASETDVSALLGLLTSGSVFEKHSKDVLLSVHDCYMKKYGVA
eukprot:g1457.t1